MSNSELGVWNAVQSALQATGLITVHWISNRLRTPAKDTTIILIGFASKFLLYLTLGFAKSKLFVYMSLLFSICSSLDAPALRSMLTKQIEENEHGQVYGMLALFQGIGYTSSQLIVQNLYKWTLNWYSGFVFILMAFVLIFQSLIILVLSKRYHYISDNIQSETSNQNEEQIGDRLKNTV
ncbi:hypothetical protein GJ496_001366 [Pomphorhynchus laevis]|nr:hypothetical protein GJ496_001366 [Pomphorhynchus laevis]